MGSTSRQRGVYGGEYALIGLRMFAWWKKNGERRLQKPGSGSAGIRSHPKWWLRAPFYRWTCLEAGARSTYRAAMLHASHNAISIVSISQQRGVYGGETCCAVPGHLRQAQRRSEWPTHRQPIGQGPIRLRPSQGTAHERAPGTPLAASIERASQGVPWPPRYPFFFFFFLLFISSK
jgi:hypothetical protein